MDEAVVFNTRRFALGDEWIGGILYPAYLGISFAERVADIPQFASQIEALTSTPITIVAGTASEAIGSDPPLVGDWIKHGIFDEHRLARKFEQILGGKWLIGYNLKNGRSRASVYIIEIRRVPGT